MMDNQQVIQVRMVPNARKNEVREENGKWKVWVTAPPVEGKANKLLVKLLAEHFNTKKSHITIIKGEKSRDKVVQVVKHEQIQE